MEETALSVSLFPPPSVFLSPWFLSIQPASRSLCYYVHTIVHARKHYVPGGAVCVLVYTLTCAGKRRCSGRTLSSTVAEHAGLAVRVQRMCPPFPVALSGHYENGQTFLRHTPPSTAEGALVVHRSGCCEREARGVPRATGPTSLGRRFRDERPASVRRAFGEQTGLSTDAADFTFTYPAGAPGRTPEPGQSAVRQAREKGERERNVLSSHTYTHSHTASGVGE